MEGTALSVISVNLWQIIISLCNLLIMFLILKKFLFKPVQNMISQRQSQVDNIFAEARTDREAAGAMKTEYEQRMANARTEADELIRNATQSAQLRSDAIIGEANAQAAHVKQRASQEIEMERHQMMNDVRAEISDMAVSIASKVVERQINANDHASLVNEFIKNVGDQQ